jgi:DNA-binding transcriptional LysR family regulator
MELLQLEYFRTVARLQHMTQAAKELNVAQPSLSLTITRLEKDLGVPLFDRQGRQIRLNRFGKAFLNRVDQVLSILEAGKRELRDMAGLQDGYISLATIHTMALPDILRTFRSKYPNVKFTVLHQTSQISTNSMIQLLEQGEIDLFITTSPIQESGVKWEDLLTVDVSVIVPSNHRLAQKESVCLQELADEPFITNKRGNPFRNFIDEYCKSAGFVPNITFEIEDPSSIQGFVSAGLAVAFVPSYFLKYRNYPNITSVKVDEPGFQYTIAVAWKEDHYCSMAATEFRTFLIEYYKNSEAQKY